MARNVKHAGKVDGDAQIKSGEPFGSTFQKSTTHAPELRKGVETGKSSGKIAPNGIVATAAGPTITCNDPAVKFPSRMAPELKSKVIAETGNKGNAPENTVEAGGQAGGGRKGYGLAKSYEKSGKSDKIRHTL